MALRPVSLSSSVTYVTPFDPAVDRHAIIEAEVLASTELQAMADVETREALAWGAFMSRFTDEVSKDPSRARGLLKYKSGESPTVFTIGVLPSEEIVRIADDTKAYGANRRSAELHWRTFLTCLRDISWPTPPKKRMVGEVEYVDPAWLRQTFVRGLINTALNVGIVAWGWNQITDAEVKN